VNADRPRRPPVDRVTLAALPDWDVEVVEESPSTNGALAARAREGAPEGLVLVTEHQTAGRGRLDRTWVTPPRAALTFSVLLRPAVDDRRWPWLPLLTGVAVVEAVRAAGGPPCSLKWPNDVLAGGRKVAGLLAERVEGGGAPAAVLGIGLNVAQEEHELPVETATSLLAEGAVVDRTALLVELLGALRRWCSTWSAAGGDPVACGLAAAYQEACVTVGQEVRVLLPSGAPLEGRAVAVDPDGALLVDAGDRRVAVNAGDVVHVRPAR
jgi:BirA family transcriptional regulator, biotin operon repressor / biotin---[acetyl-CoA-carboxylase] ligase